MRNLVRSNQLNVSHFVIHRQLLPSHSPEIPCRLSKGVPSERLRLVKWFISHRLHTGACVNLVLLTYLLFGMGRLNIWNEEIEYRVTNSGLTIIGACFDCWLHLQAMCGHAFSGFIMSSGKCRINELQPTWLEIALLKVESYSPSIKLRGHCDHIKCMESNKNFKF